MVTAKYGYHFAIMVITRDFHLTKTVLSAYYVEASELKAAYNIN